MKNIERKIQKVIENALKENRIIIIYGARQVGKTTLVQKIKKNFKGESFYYNGDLQSTREFFDYKKAESLSKKLEDLDLIIIDEAQRIKNVGLTLKILHDSNKNLKIIATGSSSFDLSNTIKEPLTGRKYEFNLYPLSLKETVKLHDPASLPENIEQALRFGQYPEIFTTQNEHKKIQKLQEITGSYLFKDVFEFQDLKKYPILESLLQLLALQLGSEVSFQELAQKLQIDQTTVQKYVYLLESAFIIFRLPAFSRNIRKEITKSRKIYFYDLGIRNTLIQNWNTMNIRNDKGALWENLCIIERIKFLHYTQNTAHHYFWRTYDQKEIDLIEDSEGTIKAYEFKCHKTKKVKCPKIFKENYPKSTFEVFTPQNIMDFLS